MLRVIAIGRLKDAPEAVLFARYAERMRPKLTLTEIPEARGAPAEIKRRDGAALLAALPGAAFAVALDQGGRRLIAQGSRRCSTAGSHRAAPCAS